MTLDQIRGVKQTVKAINDDMAQYRVQNYKNLAYINLLIDSYRFWILIISILAILGWSICTVEHEFFITQPYQNNTIRSCLLYANMMVTAILCMNIIASYIIWVKYLQASGQMLTIDRLSVMNKLQVIAEVALNWVMPLPFILNSTFQDKDYNTNQFYEQRINTFLFVLMFYIRLYHVIRVLLFFSQYMSNSSFRIWSIYGHDCTFMFAIKWWFRQYRFLVVYPMYGYFILFYGTMMR